MHDAWRPSENRSRLKAAINWESLPDCVSGPGAFALRYEPKAPRFPRLTTLAVCALLTWLLIELLNHSFIVSPQSIAIALPLVGIVGYLLEQLQNTLQPQLIWLNEHGIQLGWSFFAFEGRAPMIRWEAVERAILSYDGIFEQRTNGYVELLIPPEALPGRDTLLLCLLNPSIWSTDSQSKLFRFRLKLSGLDAEDRAALNAVLVRCLGGRKVQRELRNALDPLNSASGHPAIESNKIEISESTQHAQASRVARLLDRLDNLSAPPYTMASATETPTNLSYNPPGMVGRLYGRISSLKARLQLAILALVFSSVFLFDVYAIVPAAILIIAVLVAEHLFGRSQLELSGTGIREKSRSFAWRNKPKLLWKHISHVSVSVPPGSDPGESMLIFELDEVHARTRFLRLVQSSRTDMMYFRVHLSGLTLDGKRRFARALGLHLPRHVLSPPVRALIRRLDPSASASLYEPADAAERSIFDQTVLRYRPFRKFQKKLVAFEKGGWKSRLIVSSPIPILFLLGILNPDYGWVPATIFCAIISATFLFWLTSVANPTHLVLCDKGLCFRWRRGLIRHTSPLIKWERATFIGLTHKGKEDAYINVNVLAREMKPAEKYFFSLLYKDFALGKDNCRISLNASGLACNDQGIKAAESLKKFVSPEKIDPQVLDYLVPTRTQSYTALWLQSLSTATVRVRTEPLEENMLLAGGRYRIVKQIGSGGQGIAYKAVECDASGQAAGTVVLKEFILPSQSGKNVQQRTLESVEREANLLKSIDHPHVVKLRDLFVEDFRCYLVLEHAQGKSLRSLINEEGPMGSSDVRSMAIHLCSIIEHLHNMTPAVIHRDFTPENVIVGPDLRPKLIDFNVARQTDGTATKTVVGKHSYIPPEQFRGKATPQSDIYALGCTLHFALTGADPQPISTSHPKCLVAGVHARLDAIIARATAINVSDRYQRAEEMRHELEQIASAPSTALDFEPVRHELEEHV